MIHGRGFTPGGSVANPVVDWPRASDREFRDYRTYGVSIRSEIPLDLPEQASDGAADITLFSESPQWFAEVAAGVPHDGPTDGWYQRASSPDGSEYLRWPDLFEFMVSPDGRSVACGLLEQASLESFQTYLLGQVLSFALVKQGYEPLHATAVAVEGKAIALLGESGYGKSTLAAAFLLTGHQILTDDLLLVGDVGGALCGFQGPPRIKLFPHVAQRFVPRQAAHARMHPQTEKLIIPLERDQSHVAPAPLHGFFILDEPEQTCPGLAFTPVSGARAMFELVRSTYNARVTSADRWRRQFAAMHDLAQRVPVRRLTYPRTLSALDQVRHAVVSDVRSAAGASR